MIPIHVPGVYTITADGVYDGPDGSVEGNVTATLVVVSLLMVDSDNNGTRDEEDLKIKNDTGILGQRVLVSNWDADGDGVPDYADGYSFIEGAELRTSEGAKLVPIEVKLPEAAEDFSDAEIRFIYDASDPDDLKLEEDDFFALPAKGELRLWKKDGDERRKKEGVDDDGDFIDSDVAYSLRVRKIIIVTTAAGFAYTFRHEYHADDSKEVRRHGGSFG